MTKFRCPRIRGRTLPLVSVCVRYIRWPMRRSMIMCSFPLYKEFTHAYNNTHRDAVRVSHTRIITLTETPLGSHLLYVLGAVGPCSAVFGLRAGGLRRPRWTPDVDLIRELTGQSVPYCKSTTYNQQHRRAAPPKKTPNLKTAEI